MSQKPIKVTPTEPISWLTFKRWLERVNRRLGAYRPQLCLQMTTGL